MEHTGTKQSFVASGRSLEDAFFLERDRVLVDRRAQLHRMERTKEVLREVSGIEDSAVLDQLVRLNVSAESVAALAVVPLIEVAWADGHVDDDERAVVEAHARKHGIREGSIESDLLHQWLAQRPSPALIEAWQRYVEAICARLEPADRAKLKDELLQDVRAAAAASGGLFGLGAVSAEERAVLEQMESCFRCT
jgi:hypothetical protein